MSDLVNLVRVLTSATGNSTPITLGVAYSQLFMTPAEAGAVDGRTYTWLIVDANNWELVKGVYTASGNTVARTTVLASRSGGTLGTSRISLSGTAQVRIIAAAEDLGGVRGSRVQTGTSDTLSNTDQNRPVTYNNASAVAVSLAQAGTSNLFLDGWTTFVRNIGVGTVTITAATSTINGAASLILKKNYGAFIWSDGSNYFAYVHAVTPPALLGETNAFTDTTDATSATAASTTFAGGVGVNKKLFVTGNAAFAGTFTFGGVAFSGVTGTGSLVGATSPTITGATLSGLTVRDALFKAVSGTTTLSMSDGATTSTTTVSLTTTLFTLSNNANPIEFNANTNGSIAGQLRLNTSGSVSMAYGLAVTGASTFGNTLGVTGALTVSSSTASTSNTTGAVIVTGGLGVGGAINAQSSRVGVGYLAAFTGVAAVVASASFLGNDKVIATGANTSTVGTFAMNVGSSDLSLAYNVANFTSSGVGVNGNLTATGNVTCAGSGTFGASSSWNSAPVSAESTVSGAWPIAVKGNGRGIIFLGTDYPNSQIFCYFTTGNTGNVTGSITATTTSTVYNTTSDERLKSRFDEDGINWGERIDALWVGAYKSNSDLDGKWRLGIRAQQAYDIVPQGVTRPPTPDEMYMVDYSMALAPLAMWGVKELRARVAALEAALAEQHTA